MTIKEAKELLLTERECVSRNNEHHILCDRNCEKCDLVQDADKIIEMYSNVAEWLEELKFLRTWREDIIAELCRCDANSIEELVRKVFEKIQRKMISLHTDAIFRYGADIIEARADAFDELKEWMAKQLKEQNEEHNAGYDAGYAETYEKAYKLGKAETLEALLSQDWWNDNQRMLMEEWIKLAKEGI